MPSKARSAGYEEPHLIEHGGDRPEACDGCDQSDVGSRDLDRMGSFVEAGLPFDHAVDLRPDGRPGDINVERRVEVLLVERVRLQVEFGPDRQLVDERSASTEARSAALRGRWARTGAPSVMS